MSVNNNGVKLLHNIHRLGIDSSPIIYLVEQHPDYFDRVFTVFQQIEQDEIHLIFSTLGLAEIFPIPERNLDKELIEAYREVLLTHPQVNLRDVDKEIGFKASNLRATYNLRTPDAIHIATAILSGCDAFLTNDHQLKRVTDIPIFVLADLTPPDSDDQENQKTD